MTSYLHRGTSAATSLEILDKCREGYTRSHLARIYGVSKTRVTQIANATEAQIALWEKKADLPELEPLEGE